MQPTKEQFEAMRRTIESHKMKVDRCVIIAWLVREMGVTLPDTIRDSDLIEFRNGQWEKL